MSKPEDGSNNPVNSNPVVEPEPKVPVYVRINGTTTVDANEVDEYKLEDLVVSGFKNLDKETYKDFSFSLNKP